jgi:hypothetical protein
MLSTSAQGISASSGSRAQGVTEVVSEFSTCRDQVTRIRMFVALPLHQRQDSRPHCITIKRTLFANRAPVSSSNFYRPPLHPSRADAALADLSRRALRPLSPNVSFEIGGHSAARMVAASEGGMEVS